MLHSLRVFLTAFVLGLVLYSVPAAADEITVFAAASLTNAMGEVGQAFEQKEKNTVRFSFASSSTLAKQIENGAPAHLFLSADLDWIDYLDQRELIITGSRVDLLGNRLVLIAPAGSQLNKVDLNIGIGLSGFLSGGMLETAETSAHGNGAWTALVSSMWKSIEGRTVRADSVRAALALVERAECPLGIVYATDAAASSKVKVAGVFPADSHPPIVYPAALVKGRTPRRRGVCWSF